MNDIFSFTYTAGKAFTNNIMLLSGFDPSQLADIHLPPPVSWWPPAPGWWLLLALQFLLIYWIYKLARALAIAHSRKRRQQAAFQLIIKEFNRLKNLSAENTTDRPSLELVRSLSEYLHRLSLLFFNRGEVASLTNITWLHKLDELSGHQRFSSNYAELLTLSPYQPEVRGVGKDTISACLTDVEQMIMKNRDILAHLQSEEPSAYKEPSAKNKEPSAKNKEPSAKHKEPSEKYKKPSASKKPTAYKMATKQSASLAKGRA